MFAETLEKLLRETGAEFAIFCDFDGEAIVMASRGIDEFDVKLAGAQFAGVTIDIQKLVASTGQPERTGILCQTGQTTLLIEALPGHYYVMLSVSRPALVPFARRQLVAVAERFQAEL